MLPVKVGDVLEIDTLSAPTGTGSNTPTKSEGRFLTAGRVVEVFHEDSKCTVQVSPYEPLLRVDLKQTFFKVVYEAGEMRSLSSEMVGWEIELESADTKRLERGVVKQVDCDINCTLVLFDGGRKEWLDLTFFRVKIPGHQTISTESNANHDLPVSNSTASSAPAHEQKQGEIRGSPIHRHSGCERRVPVVASQFKLPHIDPDQFEWHLVGTHVELCDRDGRFLEGAALCSKTNSLLQLYSEPRGFYEIDCNTHGFKVVIHGLENLKKFPMGQIIDVYSPMVGHFRTGIAVKAAVVGHLTPIRFATTNIVDWVDLRTQTFKLVFLPHIPDTIEHLHVEDRVESSCQAPRPSQENPIHKSSGLDSHRSRDLEYPKLHEGQGIEIFDDQSKQYVKFKVAAQSNWSSEAYMFEPLKTSTAKHVVSSLSGIRSRLLLQPAQWEDYRRIIVGHRVDVYDRVDKNVMNGKIHAVGGGDSSDKPILLVRFKDGHQTWIDLRTNKVKLRMHPLEVVAPSDMSPRVKTSNVTDASTNSELLSTECSHNTSPAAVYPTTDLTQPNPTPALFRIPSGEDLKKEAQNPPQTEEAPTMLGSPGRKPNPGKRVPALHRRASQSTDVGKHHALPDASVSLELLTVSPNNGDDIVVSALPPSKILNAAETPGIDDFVRPMSPRGTLPPVQTNSNPNSPGKTQLLVSPTQTINVGSFASDHERIAPS